MSAQVVNLNGTVMAPEQPQPNAMLVQELERLLQAARAGQIVGMAGVYRHRDLAVTYSYAGSIGGFALIGALDCLKDRLIGAARE